MVRHHMIDGVKVDFTPDEETARDAEEAQELAEELAWANAKPMNDWKFSMQGTDSGMPRYLEDLITDNPSLTIHENVKTRYDDKVALRATKP